MKGFLYAYSKSPFPVLPEGERHFRPDGCLGIFGGRPPGGAGELFRSDGISSDSPLVRTLRSSFDGRASLV
jgi:hypothetical protein